MSSWPAIGWSPRARCRSSTSTTAGLAAGPARAVRPRSRPEGAFLSLGPVAERRLRDAAAARVNKLGTELGPIVALEAAWGRDALVAALERAVTIRRYRAVDVRSILEAGVGVPTVVGEGERLDLGLPAVPTRPLDAYRIGRLARPPRASRHSTPI